MSAPAEFPSPADPERYAWLTEHRYVAARERALLAAAVTLAGRALEIGAGEGANLHHLAGKGTVVALDRAWDKLAFAGGSSDPPACVAGDALSLPFRRGSFDTVLMRDLLHHVPDRRATIAEAGRILAPGGRLVILEANGRTLLARAFARLIPHERGLADSSLDRVKGDTAACASVELESARLLEPAPWYRLLFHYRYGAPALARSRAAVRAIEAAERIATRLGAAGSYIVVVARRRRSPE